MEGYIDTKKKKYLLISVVFLCCVAVLIPIVTHSSSNEKTPLNHLMNAINNNDISEIPKSFHEYCALAIEQNMSEEDFKEYIDGITQDMGGKFKMSYKITNMTETSQEDLESYETSAKAYYSNYPYLSNGGNLKFEQVYEVSTNMTIKGKYQDVDFLIVKIDGKYYFLHTPNQMMYQFIHF